MKSPNVSLKKVALLLLSFLWLNNVYTQNNNPVEQLENKLDSIFESSMRDQRIPGAAFIIVKDGKTLLKKGYGFTTLGEDIAYVDPDSTIFRIGSVTKSFTALALLQQIDKNKIQLEDNVNIHLSSLQIPKTFLNPITPFHLLTHSAGFDELGGRRVFSENEQIPLADFLKPNLKRIREAGEITAYSTYGIALAGLLVEDLSHLTLEEYMRSHIWEPLGMKMTSIDLPEEQGQYASLGYEMYNNINIPQPWEWYHTFPASSINSTVSDMAKYMQMLLHSGSWNGKNILNKSLTQRMLSQQLSIHPEADGFSFGLYERKWNGIASINHGGEMLGYSSFMTLIPEKNIGVFVVHHHEGTNLRYLAIEAILEDLVGLNNSSEGKRKIQSDLSEFAGTYRWLSNCQTCPGSHEQQSWALQINKDNTLSGFNRSFIQVAPLLFKSTDGQRTMAFKKDKEGSIKYMSLGNINVFEKID